MPAESDTVQIPGNCPVSRDFDPFGEQWVRDPAHTMLDVGPVYFSTELGWYVVSKMKDVREVFTDTEHFSSSIFGEPITPLCPAAVQKLKEHNFIPVKSLGTIDEPEHLPMRRRLADPFKPNATLEWEPRVREVHNQYIDRFVKRGHADLVRDFFWEAPAAHVALLVQDAGEGSLVLCQTK